MQEKKTPHSFHIPVMGTGFTIDSPLFVAKYGISSVISLVDHVLIEQMRKYWSEKYGEPYVAIKPTEEDARARIITAYLDLLQKLITRQVDEIKKEEFKEGSKISLYFELLDSKHPLKKLYESMLAESDAVKKKDLQEKLRSEVVPGDIDVNIMTKLDKANYKGNELLPYEFNDAASALRGFALSGLSSSIVLSAGFNPHLYGYISKFSDFFPDESGFIKKKICLKVSDYRSAAIQGKYLAKRGIWISEYRIESPLNCGGHAFANDGQLLGPILEEFKQRREELTETLSGLYKKALTNMKKVGADILQKIRITAQGGIGDNDEHEFLINRYDLDGTGWGTPFMLVPEATNVDDETLSRLLAAKGDDVYLSGSSPLGIPFWNLRNSISEEARRARIKEGKPGAFCFKGHARIFPEFKEKPICRASREYQALKLKELESSDLPKEEFEALKDDVLSRSCICHELGGGVLIRRDIDKKVDPSVCPGPNLVNFSRIMSLKEIVDHIYGRCSSFIDSDRPHVFIKELQLHVRYLVDEIKNGSLGLPVRSQQKMAEVKKNLLEGIDYYKNIAKELLQEKQEKFLESLQELSQEIDKISLEMAYKRH